MSISMSHAISIIHLEFNESLKCLEMWAVKWRNNLTWLCRILLSWIWLIGLIGIWWRLVAWKMLVLRRLIRCLMLIPWLIWRHCWRHRFIDIHRKMVISICFRRNGCARISVCAIYLLGKIGADGETVVVTVFGSPSNFIEKIFTWPLT